MTLDPAAGRRATEAVSGIPRDAEGPLFREPWEAQAFSMALALHQRGLFTWPEWAAALADEIKRAQAAGDPPPGETSYRHWLAALERLAAEKGIASMDALERYREAWGRAADRTPHGTPIELSPEDFAKKGRGRSEPTKLVLGARPGLPVVATPGQSALAEPRASSRDPSPPPGPAPTSEIPEVPNWACDCPQGNAGYFGWGIRERMV